jgi:hypothetical protein
MADAADLFVDRFPVENTQTYRRKIMADAADLFVDRFRIEDTQT